MPLATLFSLARTHVGAPGLSKKRALELAAKIAADSAPGLSCHDLFDSLVARERLGTTAIGHGVAIPHGRIRGHDQAIGVLVKLPEAVDFNAPDGQPVDLIFALFVPEDQCQQHLDTLADLARLFSDPALLGQLRAAGDNLSLHEAIVDWQNQLPSAANS